MCSECNIKFIGPDYTSIELMGNKAKARELMKSAGVPVVPGYEGIIENENHALNIAKEYRLSYYDKSMLQVVEEKVLE